MGNFNCAFSLLSMQYGLKKWHPCICIISFQMDQSFSPFWFSLSEDQSVLVLCHIKDIAHDALKKMYFTACALLYLSIKFGLSLYPNTKWTFLKYQCDGTSTLSFVGLQKSWIIIFSHWLFKAYFTSRRDDWQTIIHVVSDEVANIIKHVILGPYLEKEAQST